MGDLTRDDIVGGWVWITCWKVRRFIHYILHYGGVLIKSLRNAEDIGGLKSWEHGFSLGRRVLRLELGGNRSYY